MFAIALRQTTQWQLESSINSLRGRPLRQP